MLFCVVIMLQTRPKDGSDDSSQTDEDVDESEAGTFFTVLGLCLLMTRM